VGGRPHAALVRQRRRASSSTGAVAAS
jgi:hypothetical protein